MNVILLDTAVLVILLLSLARGYHRGLILTLAGLVGSFVALFGAIYISNKLLAPTTDLLAPMMETSIRNYLTTLSPETSGGATADLEGLLQTLSESPIFGGFVNSIREAMGDVVTETANSLITALSLHLAASIARIILFVAAFAVVTIAFHLLARSLDLAFHLPLLNAVNRLSGGAIGLIKGLLLVFILAWLLEGHLVPREVIESTKLFHFFCDFDLLAAISTIGLPKS